MARRTLEEITGENKSYLEKEKVLVSNNKKKGRRTLAEIKMGKSYKPKQNLVVPTIGEGSPLGITAQQRAHFEGSGKIGFWEGLFRSEGMNDLRRMGKFIVTDDVDPGDDLSFFNSITVNDAMGRFHGEDGYDYNISPIDGTPVSPRIAKHRRDEDIRDINLYLSKFAEEQIRGAHTRGKIGSGVGELPLLMLEFLGSGSIATGVKTSIKKTLQKSIKESTSKVIKESTEKAVELSLKKKIAKGTADAFFTAAVQTSTVGSGRVFGNAAEREILAATEITERGVKYHADSKDKPMATFSLGCMSLNDFSMASAILVGKNVFTPFLPTAAAPLETGPNAGPARSVKFSM